MQEFIEKARVLIEALPYIREFAGKTVVIKYGGAAMKDHDLRKSAAKDISLMKFVGMNPVVVHGGGPAINNALEAYGVTPNFHKGLRITDEKTMEIVEMVLAGHVNKDIVSLLNVAGGRAVGLCGKDGGLLHARKIKQDEGVDIGFVGEITSVDGKLIGAICGAGMIPVIAPIATDAQGNTWNINADTAASEIAGALNAEKLVFMTDTPGFLRDVNDPSSLVHQLNVADVEPLVERGVIAGGMIPKLRACVSAMELGVHKTHIIDGRVPHALLLEIFTKEGVGTLVSNEAPRWA